MPVSGDIFEGVSVDDARESVEGPVVEECGPVQYDEEELEGEEGGLDDEEMEGLAYENDPLLQHSDYEDEGEARV